MNKNIQKDKIPADLHTGIYDERKDGMFADEGLLRDGGSSAVMGAQLLAAARDGDTTAVRTLLSMPGAQSFVDYQDEHGATPLHLASYNGHASVTEQLLAARCNVDLQMKDGRNALILAQSQGQSAIVTLLTTFPNLRASMNQVPLVVLQRTDAILFDVQMPSYSEAFMHSIRWSAVSVTLVHEGHNQPVSGVLQISFSAGVEGWAGVEGGGTQG